MKSYLALAPISAKVHKRQNRMSLCCIMLAVLLVTAIFGMADMFIRSQLWQAYHSDGNWHAAFRGLDDGQAALIAARPDVAACSWYDVRNYRAEPAYTMAGKPVAICGFDERFPAELFPEAAVAEGRFPAGGREAVLTRNAKKALGLEIGDPVTVRLPGGEALTLTVSGFADSTAMLLQYDCYGVFLSTEQFRALFPSDGERMFYVQFSTRCDIQRAISEIQAQFGLADAAVGRNTKVLGLLGRSEDPYMLGIYGAAALLFVLVLSAGVMMIASSLNSNVAQRTQFFGMLRCIGATPKQVARLVRAEALGWCRLAIPAGVGTGAVCIWFLCALLRGLSPRFFAGMPDWAVSVPGMLAGVAVGLLTVLLAARTPARRASRVSPLTAVSGNAHAAAPVRRAVRAKRLRVDTALGVHHAVSNRRNFLLMGGSFALSILLFLSFTVLISFMDHAVTPLEPWTPDLSIISPDNTRSLDGALADTLRENPAVARVYGRMFAFEVPAESDALHGAVNLISYEERQFEWARDALLEGSVEDASRRCGTALAVYTPQGRIKTGDVLTLDCGGARRELEIVGMLSSSPFHGADQNVICSEETFRALMGPGGYTVVDMQLARGAGEADVDAIRALAGPGTTFSDRRASNAEVRGAYFAFAIFIYGFLGVIALIAVLNIVNSISMSVSARMQQYGAMRAVGMSARQLVRMVAAEAAAYALTGCAGGCALGLPVHRLLFEKMVGARWGDAWQLPLGTLALAAAAVAVASLLAVRGPAGRIRRMSIVDAISAL